MSRRGGSSQLPTEDRVANALREALKLFRALQMVVEYLLYVQENLHTRNIMLEPVGHFDSEGHMDHKSVHDDITEKFGITQVHGRESRAFYKEN